MNPDTILSAVILFTSCAVSALVGAYFAIRGFQKAILKDLLDVSDEEEK